MATRSSAYAAYVIAILALATLLNYYDRNLIGILMQAIKADLKLSDGLLGLLSGLAFAIVYSTLGIPIARYADGGRRVRVLGVALALWSVMTSVCGLATGFATLFLARLGVGVGEAGGLPATHALISEYSAPRWRATALATTYVASGLGVAVAGAVGGLVADRYGWRAAFWTAGVPGIVLAILILTTIREPAIAAPVAQHRPTFRKDAGELFGRRSFLFLVLGLATASIGIYGMLLWTPAYLMRTFGLSAGAMGTAYGAATAPCFLIGSALSGLLSDALSRRDPRWSVWIIAGSFVLNVPFCLALFHAPTFGWALTLAVPSTILAYMWPAPAAALIQHLSGARLRATGAAIHMATGNLVGLGLGPYIAGSLSDAFVPRFGSGALAVALSVMTVFYILGAMLFLTAARTLRGDLAQAGTALDQP